MARMPSRSNVWIILGVVLVVLAVVLLVNNLESSTSSTVTTSPDGTLAGGQQQTTPSQSPSAATGAVTYQIDASGVSDLAGVQLTLTYDPSVVQYVNATPGPFLGTGKDIFYPTSTIQTAPGLVRDLVLVRLAKQGVSGGGTVFYVHFKRVSTGDPNIHISDALVANSQAQKLPSADIRGQLVG